MRTATAPGRTTQLMLAPFADALLTHDMPGLPAERRQSSVLFTLERIEAMPSPTRLGVQLIALPIRLLITIAGATRVARFLAPTTLPILGEYVRLHRSLGYAYIWETWPDSRRDGSPS